MKYGGAVLVMWFKTVFDRITILEEIPVYEDWFNYPCVCKDFLKVSSYRSITLCFTVAKLYKRLLLNCMAPIANVLNLPDGLQTAYCKGMACSDAIFFTQEVVLSYLHSGACPLLTIMIWRRPMIQLNIVLLEKLLEVGVGGRIWQIIADWYSSAESGVCVSSAFYRSFSISRGVRHLSPLLFFIVMDSLLKKF